MEVKIENTTQRKTTQDNKMNPINITFPDVMNNRYDYDYDYDYDYIKKVQQDQYTTILAIWCLVLILPRRMLYQLIVAYAGLYMYYHYHKQHEIQMELVYAMVQ